MMNMFDPSAASAKKALAAQKKTAQENIKAWVMELLPEDVKAAVELVVCREFQCGDPKCAPIDTGIQVMFKDTARPPLQTGIPKECHLLNRDDIAEAVDEMLNPPNQPQFDPISDKAQRAYQDLLDDLDAKLGPLSADDKLGVTQRLFAAVEDWEKRAAEQQQQQRKASGHPALNLLLSYAQQNKPDEILRLIAETEGLDPSAGNSVGQTALHVACLWGNTAAAACLIANNASVHKVNSLSGGSPLHITCSSPKALEGRLECARLLLEAGADPLLADGRGRTPIEYAAAEPAMHALLAPFAAAKGAPPALLALPPAGPDGVPDLADGEDD
jgi:hypothetical protein